MLRLLVLFRRFWQPRHVWLLRRVVAVRRGAAQAATRVVTIALIAAFVAIGGWFSVQALAYREVASSPFVPTEPPPIVVAIPEPFLPEPTETPVPEQPIEPPVEQASVEQRPLPAVLESPAGSIAELVDRAWAEQTAAATGVPVRAVLSYSGASLAMEGEAPSCGITWTTIAAIGATESGHGSHGDSVLGDDGIVAPRILGPRLDGTQFARIEDTDGGVMDGDAEFDRAVGPMQFIPSTWARWSSDGSGDGLGDPHNMDDAALAAARYLCSYGDLRNPDGWRTAVYGYNHDNAYVDRIARVADEYSRAAG
jgi:membrane-bound lytic murein transglycosylase B